MNQRQAPPPASVALAEQLQRAGIQTRPGMPAFPQHARIDYGAQRRANVATAQAATKAAVVSMVNRSALHPYFKTRKDVRPRASGAGPYAVPALCAAYSWPNSAPGGGVIAIVELGGGWNQADMVAFFASVNQPLPSITDVSVDSTTNSPGNDADVEVALDIQVAAAAYYVATGKPATIRVYWSQDIASAVTKASRDGCDVCSISWGSDEANWGNAACNAMEAAALDATNAGMIVFAAAGDNDASDGGNTPANVDCPASCPHIIGCGGTTKTSTSESVWNNDPNATDPTGEGTGGGYSTVFPVPAWQSPIPEPPKGLGRMVPDCAANADPNTGYEIVVDGQPQVVGGTSAVAPLYAGLFASLGRKLGFIAPAFYANLQDFVDITQGGNGLYEAGKGPDPCTGVGVPIGTALAKLEATSPTQPAPAPTPPSGAPTSAQLQAAITKALSGGFPWISQKDAIRDACAAVAAVFAGKA